MMSHLLLRRFPIGIVWVLLLLGSGCRTYGGYDTEEIALKQIEQANRQFAQALEQARADAEALNASLAGHPAWVPAVSAFGHLVAEHAALLEAHRALYARLAEEGGSYLDVSRALGAVVSEQRRIQDGYGRILAGLQEAGTVVVGGVYQAVPPYYHRRFYQLNKPSVASLTTPR